MLVVNQNGIHQLAVNVQLQLLGGGVADAHGAANATANAQNVQLTLMEYALSYMRMILNTIVSFQGDLYR